MCIQKILLILILSCITTVTFAEDIYGVGEISKNSNVTIIQEPVISPVGESTIQSNVSTEPIQQANDAALNVQSSSVETVKNPPVVTANNKASDIDAVNEKIQQAAFDVKKDLPTKSKYAKQKVEVGLLAGVNGSIFGNGAGIYANGGFDYGFKAAIVASPNVGAFININITDRLFWFVGGTVGFAIPVYNISFQKSGGFTSSSATGDASVKGIDFDIKSGIGYDMGYWQDGKIRWSMIFGGRVNNFDYSSVVASSSIASINDGRNIFGAEGFFGTKLTVMSANGKHAFSIGSDIGLGAASIGGSLSSIFQNDAIGGRLSLGLLLEHKYWVNKNVFLGWQFSSESFFAISAPMSTANKISAGLNSILGLVDKFSGIINQVAGLDFGKITALTGNLDLNAINATIAIITIAMNNIQNANPANFGSTAAYQNFINAENTAVQNGIAAINTVLGRLPSTADLNAITAQVNNLGRTFTTIQSDLDSALKPLDGLYAVGTAFSKLYIGATLGFAF